MVPAVSPVSVKDVVVLVVSVIRVPVVGDAGGVVPGARRIMTPVKSVSVGLVQDRVAEVGVTLEDRAVTGPGGVVSGGGVV